MAPDELLNSARLGMKWREGRKEVRKEGRKEGMREEGRKGG